MTTSPLERFMRFGFATQGLLYGIVGLLALQAGLWHGGGTEDPVGVLARIERMPFGRGWLVLVAAGLVGYSLWRFAQAAVGAGGPPGEQGVRRLGRRVGCAISGLGYGALAFVAVRGAWQGWLDTSNGTQHAAARTLLHLPFGRWALLAGGLVLLGVGVGQVVIGVRASFMRGLDAQAHTALACWTGRIGLAARGIVFGLVGAFIVQAAWERNSGEIADTEGALDVLGRTSPLLFLAVAAGFVAFALYCFIQARYRAIELLSPDA